MASRAFYPAAAKSASGDENTANGMVTSAAVAVWSREQCFATFTVLRSAIVVACSMFARTMIANSSCADRAKASSGSYRHVNGDGDPPLSFRRAIRTTSRFVMTAHPSAMVAPAKMRARRQHD
jgi:hypothetical protein